MRAADGAMVWVDRELAFTDRLCGLRLLVTMKQMGWHTESCR